MQDMVAVSMATPELRGSEAAAWAALHAVADPELPTLAITDLGIVRSVVVDGHGGVAVVLTPTYSGCPATEVIQADVSAALHAAGFAPVRINTQLAPAWSSDWITPNGRQRLLEAGIVPPCTAVAAGPGQTAVLHFQPRLACPRCHSLRTERLSAFGSTACKALHRCLACGEPFEHFKPI